MPPKSVNRFDPLQEFKPDTHEILNPFLIDFPSDYHWLACPGLSPCEDCPHHPNTHQEALIVAVAGVTSNIPSAQDGRIDDLSKVQQGTSQQTSAMLNPGPQPKAAIGVFFGSESTHNVSVLPKVPRAAKITSQSQLKHIAEMMAAIAAMDKTLAILADRLKNRDDWTLDTGEMIPKRIIVKTSCETLVKGATERLEAWKKNGFKATNKDRAFFRDIDDYDTSDTATEESKPTANRSYVGHLIPNADLWQSLAVRIVQVERRHNVQVVWWYVYEQYNLLGIGLAQQVATGDPGVFAQARAKWVGQQDEVWKEWVDWHKRGHSGKPS